MRRVIGHLKNFPIFSQLQEEELHRLAACSEIVHFRRNAAIYFTYDQSHSICLVCEGRVKLARTNTEGREVILDILVKGEMFGELAICGEEWRTHNAIAIDDTLVCSIRRQEFQQLLRHHPEVALYVMEKIGQRRNELELRLEDLIFLPLEQRLVLALLRQARQHGIKGDDGSIRVNLIQKDLAHLIGASRESVAELLATYRNDGLLETGYRSVNLVNIDGLIKLLTTELKNDFYPARIRRSSILPNSR